MFLRSLAGALVALSFAACTPSGRSELTPVEGDAAMGPADAKVTLVEYGSPTCPGCKAWHDMYWEEVKNDYITPGKIKFVFREFAIHGAIDAGIFAVARCAGTEEFYAVLDEAFARQETIVVESGKGEALPQLVSLGEKFRLSEAQVKSCINDRTVIRRINDVRSDAQGKGIDSTPTFVLNGVVLASSDWRAIKPLVDAALAGDAVPEQPTAAGDDGHGHAPGETH
jgi:protein-disulfide isomerase